MPRFTMLETGAFKMHELWLNDSKQKVTTGDVELRITEVIPGGTYRRYDWATDTFKDTGITTPQDPCSHQPIGGYNTGLWENDDDMDPAAFTAGRLYVFEFWDNTGGVPIAPPFELQWSGDYGNIASQDELLAVESRIRGSDSDDLKTLSDQSDAIQASVDGISNVTRLTTTLPAYLQRPDTGSEAVKVVVNLKDTNGQMEDPDNNDMALKVENPQAVSRNANLYKDAALTTPLDDSLYSGYKKMERDDVGSYFCFYKVESTATEEQLLFYHYWEESAVGLRETKTTLVSDAANVLEEVRNQTNKMQFDGSNRIIADAEAISASVTAANQLEANIANLDEAISVIRGLLNKPVNGPRADLIFDASGNLNAVGYVIQDGARLTGAPTDTMLMTVYNEGGTVAHVFQTGDFTKDANGVFKAQWTSPSSDLDPGKWCYADVVITIGGNPHTDTLLIKVK